ncbi:MAG: EAL domain-containing protein [Clostridium sp.]
MDRSNNMKKRAIIILIICVAFLGLFNVFFNIYIENTNKKLLSETESNLKELNKQTSIRINQKFKDNLKILEAFSISAPDLNNLSDEEKVVVLQSWCEKSDFSRIGLSQVSGQTITSDNITFDMSESWYYKQSILGSNAISEPLIDVSGSDQLVLVFSVPVYTNGVVTNVLYGAYRFDLLAEILRLQLFDGEGYQYIMGNDGRVLIHSNEGEIQSNLFMDMKVHDDEYREEIISSIQKNQTGSIVYNTPSDVKRFAIFSPIVSSYCKEELNIVSVINYETAFGHAQNLITQLVDFMIVLAFIYMIIVGYILYSQNKAKEKLKKIAYYDKLCGVFNENGFHNFYRNHIYCKPLSCCSIYLDIDNFKSINNELGYEYGNQVLLYICELFKEVFGEDTVVCRFKADIFGGFYFYNTQEETINKIEEFLKHIDEKYSEQKEIILSIGIYFPEDNTESFENVFDKLSLAKKSVKSLRHTRYAIYNDSLWTNSVKEIYIADELKKAISNKDLEIYYQPKFDIDNLKVVSCEALVRWKHHEMGFVSPDTFISIAEKTQQILQVGRFVFDKACSDLAELIDRGYEPVPVAVNISKFELYQTDLIDFIIATVEKYHIDYNILELEITESTAVNDYETIYTVVQRIRALGIGISIDDFGTGYSSLSTLQNFKVDIIKLDKSFIDHATVIPESFKILKSVISLCRDLGLKTVCEGVETDEQLKMLKCLHCDYGQGYIFAKPMPLKDFENFTYKVLP